MIALKFLRRHWGKLLVLLIVLYIFLPIDDIEESLGLTSGRMAATLKIGRLAPFPKDIKNFTIWKSSGMLHFCYYGSFSGRPEIIDNWIKRSPGVLEGEAITQPDNSTKYLLQTDGGRGQIVL